MKKWEYKQVCDTTTYHLNGNEITLNEWIEIIGNEGWELVSVVYLGLERGSRYYFKREKQ